MPPDLQMYPKCEWQESSDNVGVMNEQACQGQGFEYQKSISKCS